MTTPLVPRLAAAASRAARRAILVAAPFLLAFPTLGATGPGGKTTIADLAPADTFLVASVDDWTKARAAFNASALGTMWEDASIKEFVKSYLASETTAAAGAEADWVAGLLKEIGLEKDDPREPTGPAGLALFLEKPPPAPKGDDKPDTRPRLHAVLMADFGDGAATMDGAIDKVISTITKKGEAKLDDEQHEGHTIRILSRIKPDAKSKRPRHRPGADGADDEEDFYTGDDTGPWNTDSFDTLRIVRVGNTLLACTSKATTEAAIDRLLGRPGKESDTIAGSRTFQAAMAQHPSDLHAYAVLIAGESLRANLGSAVGSMAPMMPLPFDPEVFLGALGLGAVEAFGMGVRLDTEAGVAEQSLGLVVPEKRGLLAMVDSPMAAFQPPPFAGPDCASLTTFSVRFDRLMDVIRAVYKAMPAEMRPEEGDAQLKAAEEFITPIINAIDREISVIASYKRPLGPDSRRILIALKLKDQLAIANLITGLAPRGGFEPRDFQGNQIFESVQAPVAIGIGAGYAFVGQVEDIENAMRLASEANLPRLAGTERFKSAATHAGPGGNIYSYSSIAESMAWTYWSTENADKLDPMGINGDEGKDAAPDSAKTQPEWRKKIPPIQTLLRYLGDSIFELRPTPDGFRGRWITLRPAGKD